MVLLFVYTLGSIKKRALRELIERAFFILKHIKTN